MEQSPSSGKLIVTQLVKFPSLYESRKFVTMSTIADPIARSCITFRNNLVSYGEEELAPRPTPKVGNHPFSAIVDCSFNIFAAVLDIWRPSSSAT